MELLAGLILFSAAGAWLAARARAAGAALAFGVIGTVLFCTTPLGAGVPRLVGDFVHGTAAVGGQLVDGQPRDPRAEVDPESEDAEPKPKRGSE